MRTTFSILFLVFHFNVSAQVNDSESFINVNYDKNFIRKHRIKETFVEHYINGDTSARSTFEFDSLGLLTKFSILNKTGMRVNDYFFTYNNMGHKTERKNIAYELKKTYIVTYTQKYRDSLLVQETNSEHPGLTTHFYDDKGRRTMSTVFPTADSSLGVKQMMHNHYDAHDRLEGIEKWFVNEKGAAPIHLSNTKYVYDSTGNIRNVIQENAASYQLTYDASGLLQTKISVMPNEFHKMELKEKYSYRFWDN